MKKLIAFALVMFPAVTLAHVGDHGLHNWSAGFLHPLTGLDHMLALVATGLWLAQSETRGKLGFTAGFALVLALAMVVGMQFTHVTLEAGIIATLVVLGALMACAIRGPLALRALAVAATAAIHGFVHGTELPANAATFAAALILSSLLVLGAALLAGTQIRTWAQGLVARIAGAVLILLGLGMTI
jgi:urease accessory protein